MDIVVTVVSVLSFLGVVVVDRMGSGQLPMALTVLVSAAGAAETTPPGAATANVSAPATATEAMIFLNMM